MEFLCTALALIGAAFAAPQGTIGADIGGIDGSISGCRDGEILHVDGSCVIPEVSRKVYVFDVPNQEQPVGPLPSIPPPAVDHNILFVRLPDEGPGPDPIVIPPPKQSNVVYVLNKQEEQAQRVIEVPAQPQSDPEIYFVNYQEGENPTLPIGIDLETALGSAVSPGVDGFDVVRDGFIGANVGVGGQGIDAFGFVDGVAVGGAGINLAVDGVGVGGFQGPGDLYTTP